MTALKWVAGVNNALFLVFVSDFSETIKTINYLDVSSIMFDTSYYTFSTLVLETVNKNSSCWTKLFLTSNKSPGTK